MTCSKQRHSTATDWTTCRPGIIDGLVIVTAETFNGAIEVHDGFKDNEVHLHRSLTGVEAELTERNVRPDRVEVQRAVLLWGDAALAFKLIMKKVEAAS